MFNNSRKNKIRTLEPEKSYIVNDINFKEINLSALSTIIIVTTFFLISLRLYVMPGM